MPKVKDPHDPWALELADRLPDLTDDIVAIANARTFDVETHRTVDVPDGCHILNSALQLQAILDAVARGVGLCKPPRRVKVVVKVYGPNPPLRGGGIIDVVFIATLPED